MALVNICSVGLLSCVLVYAQESPTTNIAPQLPSIVAKMQKAQSESRATASYQVIRHYQLFGEQRSTPVSEVWAEVDYSSPNHKTFAMQKRVGSNRGEEVVRRILQHESDASGGPGSAAAIDDDNYFFGYLGEVALDGSPCYLLSLNPKRKEVDLVHGKVWVDQHSFLVRRIEGQMAKNPSWLLKKVDLKIEFADMGGALVQTGMEAVADVRFLGSQTLKSQTIDVRVGELAARKTPPVVRARNRNPNRSHISAAVIVPLDHAQ
jgi:hypothetical protein